ncbi:cation-transporting P-type ATPase [Arenimonas sp.]|nr:cation-transporting P-type ATPase [Candidatus Parcubacteria bacterium]
MHTDIHTGLTTDQVLRSTKNNKTRQVTNLELALTILKGQVFSFFFIILIISGILSYFLGEKIDSIIFFSIATINTLIGFFQEFKANKSTQLLEKMISHTVTVRRNGKLEKIVHTDVVLDDILLLGPGDIVIVDILVLDCVDVFVDESVITGETLPKELKINTELHSGALITSGNVVGQVITVGGENSLMKYAKQISATKKNNSFEKFIKTISKTIVAVTVVCLILVFGINVLFTQGMNFTEYILYSISMLIGVIPESLPLVITIILTREALLLSKEKIIVKKLSVLENLGTMNYFFTDKTGTLTENSLKVKEIVDINNNNLENLLRIISNSTYERIPMSQVFDTAIANKLPTHEESIELKVTPFHSERGYETFQFGTKEVIRGQYTSVLQVTNYIDKNSCIKNCVKYESQGLRVLAIASKNIDDTTYTLEGMITFEDPLKVDAISTYHTLEDELKVNVKVITGDSPEVAKYIGNILKPEAGKDLCYSMTDYSDSKAESIKNYFVYAKCKPEQKSILIDQHISRGVVGFIGEGINDALALRRADIGFVVSNGSDIARQSGDVILLEKSLRPIVEAVKISRQAFVKIRTYLICTLTGNMGTLFSLTAVVIFWQQVPMLPIQILLNNLLTDLPLMFLISDRISNELTKKPVKIEIKKFFYLIMVFAAISSMFDFIFFYFFRNYDISILRTGWFVFSVFAELTLVYSLRSELSIFKAPKISNLLKYALIVCYIIAVSLPFMGFASIFHLVPLTVNQIILLISVTLGYLIINEITKKLFFNKHL